MNPITRPISPAIDSILGLEFPVLDKGFIRVVDYMGNDSAILEMARVSYGDGTKAVSDEKGLIRYLMRHYHTSPFEGCEIKLHVKLPIFVARQWIRHRMANVNEISARYSIIKDEFYLPPANRLGTQSKTNKQGTGDGYEDSVADLLLSVLGPSMDDAFDAYKFVTGERYDLSRELARIVLPVSTYTEWYWKIDLHNLFHFLRLRIDPHAQQEIRAYAQEIGRLVSLWVPNAYQAFLDYRLNAVTFSAMEMELLTAYLENSTMWAEFEKQKTDFHLSDGEKKEFLAKLRVA